MATKILSWNVSGVRAIQKSGFFEWLDAEQPDIVCLQESRAVPEDLPEKMLQPKGYTSLWNPAKKRGYSGTAAYVKKEPLAVANLGVDEFDDEGRLQVLEYKDFTVLNGYWPNSQSQRARLPYKLEFVTALKYFARGLVEEGKNVILCGDFNIAHEAIDLARPKDNENNAGYYKEERDAMAEFLAAGFVDTFRHFHPGEAGHYSWWTFRTQARARNIGWRIDYHCVNKALIRRVKRAWIASEVMGSDHCPVGIELK
ncbi:MAG: exodeoxyribonuclease III [Candidatus Hydrogenedentes bacterium]|nr:exodeoxyribonuclease III [Candidatus Hydrogenedentota bacterium]